MCGDGNGVLRFDEDDVKRVQGSRAMLRRLDDRQEIQFARALFRAAPGLAAAWWLLLDHAAVLPAIFAISSGVLINAVEDGNDLVVPLIVIGLTFVLIQIIPPIHQAVSSTLGHADRGVAQRSSDGRVRRAARHRCTSNSPSWRMT